MSSPSSASTRSRRAHLIEPRKLKTSFLRFYEDEWPYVVCGEKTATRHKRRNTHPLLFQHMPTPLVAYPLHGLVLDTRIVLLERYRFEPMLAITPRDLQREGFENLEEYRHYWRVRRGGWPAGERVHIFEFRLMNRDELGDVGAMLFDRLYWPWMHDNALA